MPDSVIDLTPLKVTAPGSLMLMGEHAVLFGEPALACAVDKRISVELAPREDRQVVIDSALASYRSDLDQLVAEAKLSFVLAAIQRQQAVLQTGFELRIRSEFSHTVGLGSSAAVTVAVVAALMAFSGEASGDPMAVFNESLAVVHQVQDGRGSGTDLVAAVFGGVVGYTAATAESPAQIRALKGLPQISLYYAGYKTKTPDVLKIVEQYCAQQPQLFAGIYRLMGQCTAQAELAVERSDWVSLGQLMNMYQGFMDALGVNDKQLSDIIYSLRQSDAIYAAKISGSGLGDCVLALGQDANLSIAYEQIPVSISAQGVSVEYQ